MNAPLQLRDIHLPADVLWWPPAPGWWLLLLIIVAAVLALWYWRRNRGSRRLQQLALAELQVIAENFARHHEQRRALENLSILLRRVAVTRYPRAEVAALTGLRWLQFLDSVTGSEDFTSGPGRALAEAPYNPALSADVPALIELSRRWLEAEFKRKMPMHYHRTHNDAVI
ncbi:MAG TPA: DUF4381 domain-containing protein [Gammaproteobacteria bacterium]